MDSRSLIILILVILLVLGFALLVMGSLPSMWYNYVYTVVGAILLGMAVLVLLYLWYTYEDDTAYIKLSE